MPSTYAVKAIDNNRFGGYTAVWGDKSHLDLQGDYFTKDTDFAFEAFSHRPLIHHHGQTEALDRTIIGTIDTWKKDETGLWCEGVFKGMTDDLELFDAEERELREKYIQVIKEKISRGELNFSSGALGHLVKRADDGWLKQWFWAESSTTGSPAEPRRTEVSLLKAIKGMINLDEGESRQFNPVETKQEAVTPNVPVQEAEGETPGIDNEPIEPSHEEGETDMTFDDFLAMFGEMSPDEQGEALARLQAMVTAEMPEKAEGDPEPEDEEDKEARAEELEEEIEEKLSELAKSKKFVKSVFDMVTELKDVRSTTQSYIDEFKTAKPKAGTGARGVPAAKSNRGSSRISNAPSPYEEAGWTAQDYPFWIYAMRAHNENWTPSIEFMREATAKMSEEAKSLKLSTKGYDQLQRSFYAAKADEVENTGQTGYGEEWVAEGWANTIIPKARVDNIVLGQMTSVQMPNDPYNMPIESTDPVVYAVPETTDQSQLTYTSGNAATMGKIGTDKIILTSGQLAVWVSISEFEEEDAMVPVLSQKRQQSQRAIADAMDNVILNADPAATGNINYNGGSVGTTDKWRYGGGTGLAYVPLKLNVANLANAGGSPTWAQLRDLRRLLDKAYSIRQEDLAYIVDVDTWHALSLMENVITIDKYGSDATIRTGEVGRIGLVSVFASNELALAADDGLVSNNTDLNTKGRAILMHRPTQYVGFRRQPTVSVAKDPFFGATQIRVSVRMATQRFDTDGVAMLKNITV